MKTGSVSAVGVLGKFALNASQAKNAYAAMDRNLYGAGDGKESAGGVYKKSPSRQPMGTMSTSGKTVQIGGQIVGVSATFGSGG